MAKKWAGILLLGGSLWGGWSGVARAQSQFRVVNEPVLTLRTPDAPARLRLLEQRFQEILLRADSPQLLVSLETPSAPGPAPPATPGRDPQPQPSRILLNGQLLLEVTPADAEANSTPQPADLARVWASRLQTVLNQEQNQKRLFFALGLPPQLTWQGRFYNRAEHPAVDTGRFVTDGSRIQNEIVYWEIPAGEDPFGFSYKPVLPDPPPERLFLLNRYRQFVPYEL
ncbi:MAG: hypothetical protein Q6L60_00270 [Thermostichus sp. HHBFW_bins_43]